MRMVAAKVEVPARSAGVVERPRLGVAGAGLVLAGEFGTDDASMITHALTLPAGNRPALVVVDLRRLTVVVAPHIGPTETRLALTGELDLATAQMLSWGLSFVLYRQPVRVVLDLRRLGLIDARGAHAVATASTRMGDWGGTLVLRRPRAAVRRVFELCDLGDLIAPRGAESARGTTPLPRTHTHSSQEASG